MPVRFGNSNSWTARCRRLRAIGPDCDRSAFTIIELLVVMGVVMILMSLWAPQVSKARAAAKLTRLGATIQQDALLVLAYTVDHRVFPVGHARMWGGIQHNWQTVLVDGGYLENSTAADPGAAREGSPSWIAISACLIADPRYFIPGFTEADPPSTGISESMVTYPSQKGMLLKLYEDPTVIDPVAFCCSRPWRTPVSLVDGSVLFGTYLDFGVGSLPAVGVVDQIGVPVVSTWRGCRGRDR